MMSTAGVSGASARRRVVLHGRASVKTRNMASCTSPAARVDGGSVGRLLILLLFLLLYCLWIV